MAIFKKQFKDTLKNPVLLIQFVLYPIMIIVMNNLVDIEEMPENYFTVMFTVMYIGMCPLITMASIVSEEKEKGTLRTLLMSGVNPFSYLAGIGLFIFAVCAAGLTIIVIQGGYSFADSALYLAFTLSGCIVSEILGAAIGVSRPSQSSAMGVAVPFMAVFSFLPMLSEFNENLADVAGMAYTYGINNLISGLSYDTIEYDNFYVVIASFFAVVLLFAITYRRNGLE